MRRPKASLSQQHGPSQQTGRPPVRPEQHPPTPLDTPKTCGQPTRCPLVLLNDVALSAIAQARCCLGSAPAQCRYRTTSRRTIRWLINVMRFRPPLSSVVWHSRWPISSLLEVLFFPTVSPFGTVGVLFRICALDPDCGGIHRIKSCDARSFPRGTRSRSILASVATSCWTRCHAPPAGSRWL